MEHTKFPGCTNVTNQEAVIMIKVLKKEGETNVKNIMSFIEGIDEALTIQKSAAIFDRFRGKKNVGKKSRDLIYDRLMKIDV